MVSIALRMAPSADKITRSFESGYTLSRLPFSINGSPQTKKIKFKTSHVAPKVPETNDKVAKTAVSFLRAPDNSYIGEPNKTEAFSEVDPALWTSNESNQETNREITKHSQQVLCARIAEIPPIRLNEVWRYFAESNPTILDTYENRNMDEKHVQDKMDLIRESISDYDYYIRGEESNDKTRRKLQLLEKVAPLIELKEILQEPYSVLEQRSNLMLLLRKMFSVTTGTRLQHKLVSLGTQIQQLSLPILVRGCLGYLVYHEIFLAGAKLETSSMQRAMTKGLKTRESTVIAWFDREAEKMLVFAARIGPQIDQYIRLLVLEEEDFKASLEVRARQLAERFYDILHPLTHWLTESPNNIRQEHIERLVKVTRQSLRLASELDARMAMFNFTWPSFEEPFDPGNIAPDESQADDVEAMRFDSVKRKQTVAFTLMCGVRGIMPQDEVLGRYAMATSILRTPYKDFSPELESDAAIRPYDSNS